MCALQLRRAKNQEVDRVSTDLSAIKVYRGVSIYKVRGSRYWYCRVWDRDKKRYIVKGTGETSVIGAREVAKDYALSLLKTERAVERKFTFNHCDQVPFQKHGYGGGRREKYWLSQSNSMESAKR
jgi:hypothetical protein